MGFIHGRSGSYGLGLALLALVALGTMVLTMTVVRSNALRRATDDTTAVMPAAVIPAERDIELDQPHPAPPDV